MNTCSPKCPSTIEWIKCGIFMQQMNTLQLYMQQYGSQKQCWKPNIKEQILYMYYDCLYCTKTGINNQLCWKSEQQLSWGRRWIVTRSKGASGYWGGDLGTTVVWFVQIQPTHLWTVHFSICIYFLKITPKSSFCCRQYYPAWCLHYSSIWHPATAGGPGHTVAWESLGLRWHCWNSSSGTLDKASFLHHLNQMNQSFVICSLKHPNTMAHLFCSSLPLPKYLQQLAMLPPFPPSHFSICSNPASAPSFQLAPPPAVTKPHPHC